MDKDLTFSKQSGTLYAALYNREGELFLQLPSGRLLSDSVLQFENVYAYSGIKEVWIVAATGDISKPKKKYESDISLWDNGFQIIKKYQAELDSPVKIPLNNEHPEINPTIIISNSRANTVNEITDEIIRLLHINQIREDSAYIHELLSLIDNEILTYYNIPFLEDAAINLLADFEKQLIALSSVVELHDNEQVLNSIFKLAQFAKQSYFVSSDDLVSIENISLQDSIQEFMEQYKEFISNPRVESSYYFKNRSKALLQRLGINEKIKLMDLNEVKSGLDSTEVIIYFFLAEEEIKCFIINSTDARIHQVCHTTELDSFFSDITEINHQQMVDKYSDSFLIQLWIELEKKFPKQINRVYVSGIYYLNYLDFGSIEIKKEPLFTSYQFANIFNLEFSDRPVTIQSNYGINMCGNIRYSPSLKSINILNNNDKIIRVPQIFETKEEMDYFTENYSGRIKVLKGTVKEQEFRDFFESGKQEVFFFSGHSISIISDEQSNYIPSALLLSDVNNNLNIEKFKKKSPNPADGVYTYFELKNLTPTSYNLVFLSSCQSALGSLYLNYKPASLSSVFRLKTRAPVISSTTMVAADYAFDFAREFFKLLEMEGNQDLVTLFNQTKRTLYQQYNRTGFVLTL